MSSVRYAFCDQYNAYNQQCYANDSTRQNYEGKWALPGFSGGYLLMKSEVRLWLQPRG